MSSRSPRLSTRHWDLTESHQPMQETDLSESRHIWQSTDKCTPNLQWHNYLWNCELFRRTWSVLSHKCKIPNRKYCPPPTFMRPLLRPSRSAPASGSEIKAMHSSQGVFSVYAPSTMLIAFDPGHEHAGKACGWMFKGTADLTYKPALISCCIHC